MGGYSFHVYCVRRLVEIRCENHFAAGSAGNCTLQCGSNHLHAQYSCIACTNRPDFTLPLFFPNAAPLRFAVAIGLETCYGILYASLLADTSLGADRASLAWVQSIAIFLELALGVGVGGLTDKYGARVVCFAGGALMGVGLFASSLVTSVEMLFVTYSVTVGMGMALAYGAASIAIGQYFTTKRAFANSISGAGSGVGTIVLSFAISALIEVLDWRACMRMLGIVGGSFVALSALSFIPVDDHHTDGKPLSDEQMMETIANASPMLAGSSGDGANVADIDAGADKNADGDDATGLASSDGLAYVVDARQIAPGNSTAGVTSDPTVSSASSGSSSSTAALQPPASDDGISGATAQAVSNIRSLRPASSVAMDSPLTALKVLHGRPHNFNSSNNGNSGIASGLSIRASGHTMRNSSSMANLQLGTPAAADVNSNSANVSTTASSAVHSNNGDGGDDQRQQIEVEVGTPLLTPSASNTGASSSSSGGGGAAASGAVPAEQARRYPSAPPSARNSRQSSDNNQPSGHVNAVHSSSPGNAMIMAMNSRLISRVASIDIPSIGRSPTYRSPALGAIMTGERSSVNSSNNATPTNALPVGSSGAPSVRGRLGSSGPATVINIGTGNELASAALPPASSGVAAVRGNISTATPWSPFMIAGGHASAGSIVPQLSLHAHALSALLREDGRRVLRSRGGSGAAAAVAGASPGSGSAGLVKPSPALRALSAAPQSTRTAAGSFNSRDVNNATSAEAGHGAAAGRFEVAAAIQARASADDQVAVRGGTAYFKAIGLPMDTTAPANGPNSDANTFRGGAGSIGQSPARGVGAPGSRMASSSDTSAAAAAISGPIRPPTGRVTSTGNALASAQRQQQQQTTERQTAGLLQHGDVAAVASDSVIMEGSSSSTSSNSKEEDEGGPGAQSVRNGRQYYTGTRARQIASNSIDLHTGLADDQEYDVNDASGAAVAGIDKQPSFIPWPEPDPASGGGSSRRTRALATIDPAALLKLRIESTIHALHDTQPADSPHPNRGLCASCLHRMRVLPKRNNMSQNSALSVWMDYRFWAIALAMAIIVSVMQVPETHLGAYCDDLGLEAGTASKLYSAMGLAGIIGRFGFGFLTLAWDVDLLLLMQICGVSTGLAVMGLASYAHLEWYLYFFSVVLGGAGTAIFGFVTPVLASLFGIPGLPYALGGTYTVRAPTVLLAAPIAGWAREAIGDYKDIWAVCGVLLVLSALPIALMRTECKRVTGSAHSEHGQEAPPQLQKQLRDVPGVDGVHGARVVGPA